MVPWDIGPGQAIAPAELARAQIYSLLARLLSRPPSVADLRDLSHLAGGSSPIGAALSALGTRAETGNAADIADEFEALFQGPTDGALRPYASYYLTGFLYERPLHELRAEMTRLGFARNDGVSEPEDHIASVLEIMANLILGPMNDPAPIGEQRRFFDAHIGPWAEMFFADLQATDTAPFYHSVGTLGRIFIAGEKSGLSIATLASA